jgi:t-SNARE complex subunit (syntaxin)
MTMADFPKFDEEFKQNVSEKFQNVKEKVSDALLTEEGKLDTERIGNAVTDTAKKDKLSKILVVNGCFIALVFLIALSLNLMFNPRHAPLLNGGTVMW